MNSAVPLVNACQPVGRGEARLRIPTSATAGSSKLELVSNSSDATLDNTFTPDKPVKTKSPVSADMVNMLTLTGRFIVFRTFNLLLLAKRIKQRDLPTAVSLSETTG